ncbi:hypothetical protein HRbin09_01272 [bacterium HR09]|nr:hypothetical protein HRbin09_01272 [bacterium HR09]
MVRQGVGLQLPRVRHARFPVGNSAVKLPANPVLHRAVLSLHKARVLGARAEGRQVLKGRLHARLFLHHRPHRPLHLVEDHRHRAEVHDQGANLATGFFHFFLESVVHRQIGGTPPVDGLLGVPHQKQPRPGLLVGERQKAHKPALPAVGVLKLVHQQLLDPGPFPSGNVGVPGKQPHRAGEQVLVGDEASLPQAPVNFRQERFAQQEKGPQGLRLAQTGGLPQTHQPQRKHLHGSCVFSQHARFCLGKLPPPPVVELGKHALGFQLDHHLLQKLLRGAGVAGPKARQLPNFPGFFEALFLR